MLAEPGALPGGEWAVLFIERGWPTLFVCVTAIAFVFPDGRLPSPAWRRVAVVTVASFAVLIVVSLACRRALQRRLRPCLEPAARAVRVDHRRPVHAQRPRGVGRPVGRGCRHRDEAASGIGRRALPAQVARLRGGLDSGVGGRLPGRDRDHGRRWPGDDWGHRPHHDGDNRRDRGRDHALPPLRDRPPGQPHARLRGVDRRPGGDVRGGLLVLGGGDRVADRRSRPRRRRWPWRWPSGRCDRGSSGWWTGASTALATRGWARSSVSSKRSEPGARPRRGSATSWRRRSATHAWSCCSGCPARSSTSTRPAAIVDESPVAGRARMPVRRARLPTRDHRA